MSELTVRENLHRQKSRGVLENDKRTIAVPGEKKERSGEHLMWISKIEISHSLCMNYNVS